MKKNKLLLRSTYDINLSYFIFAQSTLCKDIIAGMSELNINRSTAEVILSLTLPQMLKLSEANQIISQVGFDKQKIMMYMHDSTLYKFEAENLETVLNNRILKNIDKSEE